MRDFWWAKWQDFLQIVPFFPRQHQLTNTDYCIRIHLPWMLPISKNLTASLNKKLKKSCEKVVG